jgi:hypothetical protein
VWEDTPISGRRIQARCKHVVKVIVKLIEGEGNVPQSKEQWVQTQISL